MTHNCNSIFLYNKHDELVTYVELGDDQELVNYYNLKDREFTRLNICKVKERNKWYTDVKKAKIIFDEDCYLFHIFLDGEGFCRANKKGSLRLEPPRTASKIYSHNDKSLEGYTVSSDLMEEWLKKL